MSVCADGMACSRALSGDLRPYLIHRTPNSLSEQEIGARVQFPPLMPRLSMAFQSALPVPRVVRAGARWLRGSDRCQVHAGAAG